VEWPSGAGCVVVFGGILWSSFQVMMFLPRLMVRWSGLQVHHVFIFVSF